MNQTNRLYRFKTYLTRAYGSWIGWMFTMGTFFLISYETLIIQIPMLLLIFPNIFVYIGIMVPTAISFMVIFGRWDMKRGSYKIEQKLSWGENPEWAELRDEVKELRSLFNDLIVMMEDYKK